MNDYYYKDKESAFSEELEQILMTQELNEKEKIHKEYLLSQADNNYQYRADLYLDIKSLPLKDENGNSTEIPGPIVFELKRQLQFDTVSRCLKLHKRLQPTDRYRSFVLIYFNENHFSRNLQTSQPAPDMHGFIPQNKGGIDTPMPVLSEEQYHEVYANAYNWGNIEQLHALNRTTCFFVGLSMTTPTSGEFSKYPTAKRTTKHAIMYSSNAKLILTRNKRTNASNMCRPRSSEASA